MFEISKKLYVEGEARAACEGVPFARLGVLLLVGGLWEQTRDLDVIVDWVRDIFAPLVIVARDTYTKA